MYNNYSIIIRSKCSLDSSNSSGSSSKSTEEVVVVEVGNFSFCKKKINVNEHGHVKKMVMV